MQVIGGYPVLLTGGVARGDLGVAERPSFAAVRHPRTAVGFDSRGSLLWLVVVDGRQAPWSAGMSLPELTDLLRALGADEALNLDGGGLLGDVAQGAHREPAFRRAGRTHGGQQPLARPERRQVRRAVAVRREAGRRYRPRSQVSDSPT